MCSVSSFPDAPNQQAGCVEYRGNQHDGRPGAGIQVIGRSQADNAAQHGDSHRPGRVLPRRAGQVPPGRGRQDQQRVDQHHAHPPDGKHHRHRHQHHKPALDQPGGNPPGAGQERIHAGQQQRVVQHGPQRQRHRQGDQQVQQVFRRHRQDIADQQRGVFRELSPARQNQQTRRDRGGGKHRDNRICGSGSGLLDQADHHRPHNAENQHRHEVVPQAQEDAQPDARQRGVPQRVRKEGHLVVHRHRAQQAEQRGQQKDCQERVFHKRELVSFQRKNRAEDAVDRIHSSASSSPLRPNTE